MYTGLVESYEKQTLIRNDFKLMTPAVRIVKYANGHMWTYEITNLGQVAVAQSDVSVTDDQTGVSLVFYQVISGYGDTIFDLGEV